MDGGRGGWRVKGGGASGAGMRLDSLGSGEYHSIPSKAVMWSDLWGALNV